MDLSSRLREGRIDVRELVASKNPRLARLLPGFVYRYLHRILHLDEVNHEISRFQGLGGGEFSRAILDYFDVEYQVHGMEHLRRDGRYLIVSNHPLGGMDGMVLIDHFGHYFDRVYFPVNDLLLNLPAYSDVFLPINKHGNQLLSDARHLDEVYRSSAQMLYFPAGLCSRRRRGRICDLKWHGNFVSKAVKYARDVVPVFFQGRNSDFFYRLANLRKRLGIKGNIEMLYLVDEMFKQRGSSFGVYVGEPFSYQAIYRNSDGLTREQWADRFKSIVYAQDPCSGVCGVEGE